MVPTRNTSTELEYPADIRTGAPTPSSGKGGVDPNPSAMTGAPMSDITAIKLMQLALILKGCPSCVSILA
jgi:hypothetical protein